MVLIKEKGLGSLKILSDKVGFSNCSNLIVETHTDGEHSPSHGVAIQELFFTY